jgi:hypothetical protein
VTHLLDAATDGERPQCLALRVVGDRQLHFGAAESAAALIVSVADGPEKRTRTSTSASRAR